MPKLHVSDCVAPTFGLAPTRSNAPAPLAGLQTGCTLWQATGAVDHALPPFAVLLQCILDIAVPSFIRRLSSWCFSVDTLVYAPYVLLAAGCTPIEVRKPAQEA